ncbi:hypothetical protein D3C87_719850 [compost metagenome]
MELYEGDNIGSLLSVEIAHQADFASFNPAIFKAGKDWVNVPFVPEKARFNLGEEETKNGPLFSYGGDFFLNKLRDEVFTDLHKYIGRKAVLKLTDLNGEVYIIGAPGYPCTLAFDGGTGGNYTDANGGKYQFKTDQPFRFFRA